MLVLTNHQLPITNYQLSIINYQLPITNHQSPITNHQLPITNYQLMNSCILMAEIVQAPQLRYTPDNQTQIAEMLVQFPGSRPEDPPSTLKVIGWGNLAQEIHGNYHQGDRIIIKGRLNMNTIERKPEGFKEKRAELTAEQIYSLGAAEMTSFSTANISHTEQTKVPTNAPVSAPSNVVSLGSRNRGQNPVSTTANQSSGTENWESNPSGYQSPNSPSIEPIPSEEGEGPDYDPIPF
ncbi:MULTISPECIES: single-stranded DNA-binding protein [Kamptonema]|uniref:single-stranded DNA-binding protein n=1 Tax=Kamptonema TaxID=1501433 RepID=UPI0001DAD3F2|nr:MULTISPECIES: single-stranded DNA-binding protein [Kamptonema]CBN58862.1 Single-stranded DNA-binding protein [Kamptonema sp. PCC 6506]